MAQMPAVAKNWRVKRFQMVWKGQNTAANITLNGSNGKLLKFWWRIFRHPPQWPHPMSLQPFTDRRCLHSIYTTPDVPLHWILAGNKITHWETALTIEIVGIILNRNIHHECLNLQWLEMAWGWFDGAIRPLPSSGWPVSWSPFPTLDFFPETELKGSENCTNHEVILSYEVMRHEVMRRAMHFS